MSRHAAKRINRHSLIFWLTPILLSAILIGAALFFQPQLKNVVDHVLILGRFMFQ
jgi:hypothetical protein